MEIYAPIANRLGLNDLHHELQDLSFKYLHPNRYAVLSKALQVARGNRREVVGKILEAIRKRLAEHHIEADVTGREKDIYSIYRKMQSKSLAFAEVLDIYGFRVLVNDFGFLLRGARPAARPVQADTRQVQGVTSRFRN